MILSKINDLFRYGTLHPLFAKSFEWLKGADLEKLDNGKVIIDGDHIFANVQGYATKSLADAAFEAHRNYIDIQVVFSGAERMDIASVEKLAAKDQYNAEKDVQKFDGEAAQTVNLVPGYACILFPEDAHRPCVHPDGKTQTQVRKVCMKIRI